jgi:high-affinity iron transporter
MNEFLIVFRESLEAALILGILSAVESKKGANSNFKLLYTSLFAALVVSFVLGYFIISISAKSAYVEAPLILISCFLMLHMIYHFGKQKNIKADLEQKSNNASKIGLFLLVFTLVLRESTETVIFLNSIYKMQGGLSIPFIILGFGIALGIGYAIFVRGKRIALNNMFKYSSILLIFMAAAMAGYAAHEIFEIFEPENPTGILTKAWDILPASTVMPESNTFLYTEIDGKFYHFLHHKGWLGNFFKVLVGYRSNMRWFELFSVIGFAILGFAVYNKAQKIKAAA